MVVPVLVSALKSPVTCAVDCTSVETKDTSTGVGLGDASRLRATFATLADAEVVFAPAVPSTLELAATFKMPVFRLPTGDPKTKAVAETLAALFVLA